MTGLWGIKMTTVSINNDPVAVVLASGESVTVPSGEVWRVWVSASQSEAELALNGDGIAVFRETGDSTGAPFTGPLMFTGGDTLDELGSEGGNIYISGYEVS